MDDISENTGGIKNRYPLQLVLALFWSVSYELSTISQEIGKTNFWLVKGGDIQPVFKTPGRFFVFFSIVLIGGVVKYIQNYLCLEVEENMRKLWIGAGISLFVLSTCLCFAADKVVVVPLSGRSGEIPAGAVMYFNLASCPDGWSPLSAGQGRVLVGISSAGGLGTTFRPPLSDGGSRVITAVPSHQHTVNPAAFSTSSSGGHIHNLRIEDMASFGDYAVAGSENNAGGDTFQISAVS